MSHELELDRNKEHTESDIDLETIIKRNSLKEVCKDCDYEAPNKSRRLCKINPKYERHIQFFF